MYTVIIVDSRPDFLAEVAADCRGLDAEVIPIESPQDLRAIRRGLHRVVLALWADCPSVAGVPVARSLLRALAAGRQPVPVILYGARSEALTEPLEPGVPYPHLVTTAHACTVAGVIRRVVRTEGLRRQRVSAFEDWAHAQQVPIAGRPGQVSVVAAGTDGTFTPLGDPQNALAAVGTLVTAGPEAGTDPLFY